LFLIPLLAGTEESPSSTYLWVGTLVLILGVIVFFLGGGLGHPTSGYGYVSFLLSLFLVVLGIATLLTGLGVRLRRERTTRIP
jgi:uncharacterized membrane protein YhaH (DUF805 family)